LQPLQLKNFDLQRQLFGLLLKQPSKQMLPFEQLSLPCEMLLYALNEPEND
jgi:hypothetical protein